jgi:hypothetical protein
VLATAALWVRIQTSLSAAGKLGPNLFHKKEKTPMFPNG